jgi:hypothetical protein
VRTGDVLGEGEVDGHMARMAVRRGQMEAFQRFVALERGLLQLLRGKVDAEEEQLG